MVTTEGGRAVCSVTSGSYSNNDNSSRPLSEINRIYDGVEAETRKSQASFQIFQVSSEALPRMRLE